MVELRGFEPLTPRLPALCSPNRATAPREGLRYRAARKVVKDAAENCFGTGGGLRTRTPLRAWRFERHEASVTPPRLVLPLSVCPQSALADVYCTAIRPLAYPRGALKRVPEGGGNVPQ